jgi:hypothetical protein
MTARDELFEGLTDGGWRLAPGEAESANALLDAFRDDVRSDILGTDLNPSTLVLDASAYRILRPAIEATMAEPDRWDGDEAEVAILARYVKWLAAGRAQVRTEVLTEAAAKLGSIADAVVFALDAAGLLQTPEIAAELARLRGLTYDAPHVWQVWEEDGPLYGVYASQAAAEDGTIDCYRDMGESCPDYSWKWDSAGTGELLAGGDPVGIYLGRHKVRTVPAQSAEPDFFQPGQVYQRGTRWTFHCLAVAARPWDGEVRAVGYLTRGDGTGGVESLNRSAWEHEGWAEATEGGTKPRAHASSVPGTCARARGTYDWVNGTTPERETPCRPYPELRCVTSCRIAEGEVPRG